MKQHFFTFFYNVYQFDYFDLVDFYELARFLLYFVEVCRHCRFTFNEEIKTSSRLDYEKLYASKSYALVKNGYILQKR